MRLGRVEAPLPNLPHSAQEQADWEAAIAPLFSVRSADGFWAMTSQSVDFDWGWKIHLACSAQNASTVIARLRACDASERLVAKTPARFRDVGRLNAGVYGYTQIGKIFTFYGDAERLLSLVALLKPLLKGIEGPIVPFENRVPGSRCLYYRYGRYRASWQGDDNRTSTEYPEGVVDPFQKFATPASASLACTPVYACLSQRAKGGTYLALDLRAKRARRIVVKEGRRFGEIDRAGIDGLALVRNEERILQRLAPKGLAPLPLGRLATEDALYIFMEFIEGRTLAQIISERRLPVGLRDAVICSLARALAGLHKAGCVWGDCKPSNILVQPRGRLRLLDFEGARLLGERPTTAWRSPVFAEPHSQWRSQDGRPADVFALGKTLALMLEPWMSERRRPHMSKKETAVAALIRRMTRREIYGRPRMEEVVRVLECLRSSHTSRGRA